MMEKKYSFRNGIKYFTLSKFLYEEKKCINLRNDLHNVIVLRKNKCIC